MNKQKFTNIVANQAITNAEDLKSLEKIVVQHPYSQIAHTLLAKSYRQMGDDKAKMAIQHAAIYATDRIVLKEVIESKAQSISVQQPETVLTEPKKVVVNKEQGTKSKESKKFDNSESIVTDIDHLRQGIFKNLDLLQTNMESFNNKGDEALKKSKATKKKSSSTDDKKATAKKASVKKKAKSVKKSDTPTPETTRGESQALSQKEQVDLIEKFIKSPPKINKNKNKAQQDTEQPDLSNNTTNLEEDFASENLAQILTKQGNKEKAIEIYKKLIWKFPQKKAYFATQIEELKK